MKRVLAALTKFTDGVAVAANAVGTLVVLILVMVVNYDMGARNLFNAPFNGAVEVVQFSMVLIVFLQLPDVVRVNRLTRSDGFLVILGGRYPDLAKWTRRAINLASAIFMTLVAIAIFPEFLKMWETNDFFGVPGVFTAPWWPVKLTIFASAVLAALIFSLKVLGMSPDTATHTAGQEDVV
ncbi:MAG: TRAP transporter small permease [Rhodobacteraceae bacterium]|nr:TRAP transporter small permease [Paracoccaceae bacterium]